MLTEYENVPRELIPKMEFGAEQAVNVCMQVKRGEKVVVVRDNISQKVTPFIERKIVEAGGILKVVQIEDYGQRPLSLDRSNIITSSISEADAAFVCTQYFQKEFLTFLKPVTDLTDNTNLRLAMMFDQGLDLRLMTQGMNANYLKVKDLTWKLFGILKDARKISVTTEKGTNLTVDLGYKWIPYDGFPEKGRWVNLPDGEILTTPKDINGHVVIDGVVEEFDNPMFGKLDKNPIEMDIKDGKVIVESVESVNKPLQQFVLKNLTLDSFANRIGEFAFGTNIDLSELIGNLGQDEKFPSVHIAWGDPYGAKTGADWTSVQHQDAVILKTTVDVDGQIIMKEGSYKI